MESIGLWPSSGEKPKTWISSFGLSICHVNRPNVAVQFIKKSPTGIYTMADLSDQQIQDAYQDVRSDKTDTNWVLLDYETDRSDKLTVTQTGTGGLTELREVLQDGRASFAYARVTYSNDKESQREKFILIVWIGPQCKVMRKAKISVHAADVKTVLRVYSIEVAAEKKEDLNEEPIVKRLRKAGGASYDGV